MFPWTSPIVIVQKHASEGVPQQFNLCIDYRKLNSLLPGVMPAMGTKKDTFALMPLPKIDELFFTIKRSEVLHSTGSPKCLLPHKIG